MKNEGLRMKNCHADADIDIPHSYKFFIFHFYKFLIRINSSFFILHSSFLCLPLS